MHLSTTPDTEALIQRAEALDDDKLKEKEALTTQAVEGGGWSLQGVGGSFWVVIFPGLCTWRFAPGVFRIHVQRPQESKIIELREIPFGRVCCGLTS